MIFSISSVAAGVGLQVGKVLGEGGEAGQGRRARVRGQGPASGGNQGRAASHNCKLQTGTPFRRGRLGQGGLMQGGLRQQDSKTARQLCPPMRPCTPEVEEAAVEDKDAHGVSVAGPPHGGVIRHVIVTICSRRSGGRAKGSYNRDVPMCGAGWRRSGDSGGFSVACRASIRQLGVSGLPLRAQPQLPQRSHAVPASQPSLMPSTSLSRVRCLKGSCRNTTSTSAPRGREERKNERAGAHTWAGEEAAGCGFVACPAPQPPAPAQHE